MMATGATPSPPILILCNLLQSNVHVSDVQLQRVPPMQVLSPRICACI